MENFQHLKAFVLAMLLTLSPATTADAVKTPDHIPGITQVDAEGVLALVEKAPQLVIIDSRIAMDRKQGHIEGSRSLPDTGTNCVSLARIIPAKNHPALFYCNGVKCGRSDVAVKIARQCGYTQLYWYRDGFEDWKLKGYPYLNK